MPPPQEPESVAIGVAVASAMFVVDERVLSYYLFSHLRRRSRRVFEAVPEGRAARAGRGSLRARHSLGRRAGFAEGERPQC